jgi:small membrane protein
MEIIQIMILIFALFAFSRVYTNIKLKNLERLEAIFWGIFWILVIITTLMPEMVSNIANKFGVGRGVDLIIYFSIIILSYLIFRLYAQITKLERNITKIIRTIAIKNEKGS